MSDTTKDPGKFIVRLPPALAEALTARAKAAGLSRNAYIQRVLEADTGRSITTDTTAPQSATTAILPAVAPAVSPVVVACAVARIYVATSESELETAVAS